MLPGTVTGEAPQEWLDPDWRRCRVYATPTLSKARSFAGYIDGVVYRVRLNGRIGIDVCDVRAVRMVMCTPQYRQELRRLDLSEDEAVAMLLRFVPVSMTGDSATVLEVLDETVAAAG